MGDFLSALSPNDTFRKSFLTSLFLSLPSSKANPLCGEVHQEIGVSHQQGKGLYLCL